MGKRQFTRFSVHEYASGFALRDHAGRGREHGLSDGVDVLHDEEGNAIPPGGRKFCIEWGKVFNANVEETLEAYWPRKGE